MHEGSSGSIRIDGYENNQEHFWQINSDCESIHFKSKFFDTHFYDYFYIEEEGGEPFWHYGDEQFDHTTNTGTALVSVDFSRFQSDSDQYEPDKTNESDGFEIDWQCAESNENDGE